MDIAYYLSELLGELGEVNVPGLGSFTQKTIEGHYNDTEGKFYPPTADVHYSRHFVDDDVLATYIAGKKNISIASSKYFIEKYSSKVSVEVMMEDVQLGNLGWIYPIGDGLAFRRSPKPLTHPAFYGYPQIELKKLGSTSFLDQYEAYTAAPRDEVPEPVAQEEPVSQPETISEPPVDETPAPVISEPPVAEPEAVDMSPMVETPSILTEETPVHKESEHVINEDTPVADRVDLVVPEPEPVGNKESSDIVPVDFGASMEDYLRELEGGAYIAGPEVVEQSIASEPVTEIPETEATPEQITASIPEPEAPTEPVIELPEDLSIPEPVQQVPQPEQISKPLIDVPFPEHIPLTYTNKPELQEMTPNQTDAKTEPEIYKSPVLAAPVRALQDEEEFVFDGKGYDDVDNSKKKRNRSYLWLWITLAMLLLLAGAAAYVYHKHEVKKMKAEAAAVAVPLKPIGKNDTSKSASPADSIKDTTQNKMIRDTTQKAITPAVQTPAAVSAIDSTKVRYELIGTKCPTISEANLRVKNYKSLGIADAHIVTGPIFGRLIKVSLGTYQNRIDAIARKKEIVKSGKVRNIDLQKVNPKK